MERRDPPSEELKLGHAVPQMLMVVLVAVLYAAIAPLILVPAAIYFCRGAGLPEAFTISIYKNERGRRRGVVSRAAARTSALSLGIGQLALFSYNLTHWLISARYRAERQDGRARRRLAPGPCRRAPARDNLRALSPRRAARTVEPAVHLHRDAATRRDLFRDLSEADGATYYRQPALVDDDDVAAQARRASSRSGTGSGTSRPWASRNSRADDAACVMSRRVPCRRRSATCRQRHPAAARPTGGSTRGDDHCRRAVSSSAPTAGSCPRRRCVGGGKQGPDERDEPLLKIGEVRGIALRHRQGQPTLFLQLGLAPELLHDQRGPSSIDRPGLRRVRDVATWMKIFKHGTWCSGVQAS